MGVLNEKRCKRNLRLSRQASPFLFDSSLFIFLFYNLLFFTFLFYRLNNFGINAHAK